MVGGVVRNSGKCEGVFGIIGGARAHKNGQLE